MRDCSAMYYLEQWSPTVVAYGPAVWREELAHANSGLVHVGCTPAAGHTSQAVHTHVPASCLHVLVQNWPQPGSGPQPEGWGCLI